MNEPLFKSLLEKYLTGSLSDAERVELSGLLEQPEYQMALEETLLQEYQSRRFEGEGHEKILEKIEHHILSNIASPKIESSPEVIFPQKRRIISFSSWAAAAAVLVLVLGGYFLFSHDSGKTKTPVAVNQVTPDILPGGNKAVLTLTNGSKIILDSVANGELAQQGNTKIIKSDSGKIVYAENGHTHAENGLNILSTPRGGMYQLILPDGTKVWLNSASSITYPTAFNGKQRNVSITGEAYFEVAKDKERPFHVAVNDMNIEVLGTHFNINSYADETDVKTTLLEGSIKLTTGNYNTLLKPGEQAQLGKNGRVNILHSEDMEQVMAWKTGYFNFKNAELPMVMRQLERWYDIDVHYEGEISQRRFQGELPRSMTLQEVLNVLREVKIKYKINGKMLIIYN